MRVVIVFRLFFVLTFLFNHLFFPFRCVSFLCFLSSSHFLWSWTWAQPILSPILNPDTWWFSITRIVMLVLKKQKTKNWGTDANLKLIVATSRIASAKNGLNGQEVMLIQDQRFQKWAFWCYLQWFWKCCFDDQRNLPRKMPNSVNFVFFKKCVPILRYTHHLPLLCISK